MAIPLQMESRDFLQNSWSLQRGVPEGVNPKAHLKE
jgi:hypothetical protein